MFHNLRYKPTEMKKWGVLADPLSESIGNLGWVTKKMFKMKSSKMPRNT